MKIYPVLFHGFIQDCIARRPSLLSCEGRRRGNVALFHQKKASPMNTRTPVSTRAGLLTTALACLMTGERHESLSSDWHPANERQAKFLALASGYRAIVLDGNLPIETVFSRDSEVVNQFLRDRGMTIEISPCSPDERAFAAVMTLKVNWPIAGEETRVNIRGTEDVVVEGVCIRRNYLNGGNMHFFRAVGHEDVVVRLQTKEGDTVVLTRASEDMIGLDGPELFERAIALVGNLVDYQPPSGERPYDRVEFPRAAFDIECDLSYFVNLWTTQPSTGQVFRIVEAKGQVRGELTKIGAEVIEAVAMKGVFECARSEPDPVPLVIDDAFLMIIERNGQPVSVLVIGDDAWTLQGS